MTQARMRSIGPDISEQASWTIKALREARGWDYEDLAWQIRDTTRHDPGGPKEISAAVLRNIELGVPAGGGERLVRRIVLDEAVVFARVFGVSIDFLVYGKD